MGEDKVKALVIETLERIEAQGFTQSEASLFVRELSGEIIAQNHHTQNVERFVFWGLSEEIAVEGK